MAPYNWPAPMGAQPQGSDPRQAAFGNAMMRNWPQPMADQGAAGFGGAGAGTNPATEAFNAGRYATSNAEGVFKAGPAWTAPSQHVLPRTTPAETSAYWTPERMKNATPAPNTQVVPQAPTSPYQAQPSQAAAPQFGMPYQAMPMSQGQVAPLRSNPMTMLGGGGRMQQTTPFLQQLRQLLSARGLMGGAPTTGGVESGAGTNGWGAAAPAYGGGQGAGGWPSYTGDTTTQAPAGYTSDYGAAGGGGNAVDPAAVAAYYGATQSAPGPSYATTQSNLYTPDNINAAMNRY